MIDTIKIYTQISKDVYEKIHNQGIMKSSINMKDGEIYYKIITDKLVGSYDNSLSIRPYDTNVFGFDYKRLGQSYALSIEGSYHKVRNGYNSHNGYYNLISIVKWFIASAETQYNVKLPSFRHWFLQRIDIALVFDLGSNENVRKYINNLGQCTFPRRDIKHYGGTDIYFAGTTTTLKIYNKKEEFKAHDLKKLAKTSFNVLQYTQEVDGFIRFECEVKKKKLEALYGNKYIRVNNVRYEDLKKVWSEEFMKLLNLFEVDRMVVRNKEDVKDRLIFVYGERTGNLLYSFYSSIVLDGEKQIKASYSKATYYRNVKRLKDAGVDFSQRYTLQAVDDTVDFNPFTAQEVM